MLFRYRRSIAEYVSNGTIKCNPIIIHDINIVVSLPRQIGNRDNYVQYENMRDLVFGFSSIATRDT